MKRRYTLSLLFTHFSSFEGRKVNVLRAYISLLVCVCALCINLNLIPKYNVLFRILQFDFYCNLEGSWNHYVFGLLDRHKQYDDDNTYSKLNGLSRYP